MGGGYVYSKSSHLSMFTSLKHLMVLLMSLFSELHFYTLSKTLRACRAMQLNFFLLPELHFYTLSKTLIACMTMQLKIAETLLDSAFKVKFLWIKKLYNSKLHMIVHCSFIHVSISIQIIHVGISMCRKWPPSLFGSVQDKNKYLLNWQC